MRACTTFEAHWHFDGVLMLSTKVRKGMLNIILHEAYNALVGMTVQIV